MFNRFKRVRVSSLVPGDRFFEYVPLTPWWLPSVLVNISMDSSGLFVLESIIIPFQRVHVHYLASDDFVYVPLGN
jgi:hypothetical protein